MSDLSNPVSAVGAMSMAKHMKKIECKGEEISTGKKNRGSIVDSIIGSKLSSTSKILTCVSKGITYATNMTNCAESNLIEVKDKLIELKQLIATAQNASGDLLTQLDDKYRKGEDDIQRLLNNAKFNGKKLFDHNGNEEIRVRVGEEMDNNVKVNLPDLRIEITGLTGTTVALNVQDENTKHTLRATSGNGNIAVEKGAAGGAWGQAGVQTANQNQTRAYGEIEGLLTRVDDAIVSIGSQLETLKSSYDSIINSIGIHDQAAKGYLDVDYEEAAKELKEAMLAMRATIATINQGWGISNAILQLIEN